MKHQVEVFKAEHITKLSLFPRGTRVVVALPRDGILGEHLTWHKQILSFEHIPIPTLPARRIKSEEELETFLIHIRELQLKELMIVSGNDESFGVYQDALGLLMHLMTKQTPIQSICMPGHPEHVKVTSESDVLNTLAQKISVIQAAGWNTHLISQVCLSEKALSEWIEQLSARKLQTRISIGVVPSCTKETLVTRLQMCAVLRKAEFSATYQALDSFQDSYDAFGFVQSIQSVCAHPFFESLHWYGFDDLEGIVHDIGRIS